MNLLPVSSWLICLYWVSRHKLWLNFKYHDPRKHVASRWITMVNSDMFKWERCEGAPRASTTSTTVKMIVREDVNCTVAPNWAVASHGKFFGLCSADWLNAKQTVAWCKKPWYISQLIHSNILNSMKMHKRHILWKIDFQYTLSTNYLIQWQISRLFVWVNRF